MSGNPVSRMWRRHRLKKQYQKRAREAVKTGAAGAAKKTAAATEKAGAKAVGFVKRHPVGVLAGHRRCVLLPGAYAGPGWREVTAWPVN